MDFAVASWAVAQGAELMGRETAINYKYFFG
jgi:hypothetical protein